MLITAAGAPLALAFAAFEPAYWYAALAWPLTMVLLTFFDALSGRASPTVQVAFPVRGYVGETRDCELRLFVSKRANAAWVALDDSPLIAIEAGGRARAALDKGRGAVVLALRMARRGVACFEGLWLRWTGPLGLSWHQSKIALDASFPVLPDLRPVQARGANIFRRYALEGLITQLARGEGSDLDALIEFQTGMDRRSIDWKQSARHMKLLARQYRTDRNNQIVFAVDSGRQMCEPVGGLARIDRCVSALLLSAWVALKLGDRVAIEAFDSRPRIASGFVSGGRAFGEIERTAARIDYSGEEANYTFALTTLAARLTRRSMIILFTEFADDVSADFLVRGLRKLVEMHLVMVVVLRDEELEAIAEAEPTTADDVTRAVTAAGLLKDRQVVIKRLQHLGVHVVEAGFDKVTEALVQNYLSLKKRDLL